MGPKAAAALVVWCLAAGAAAQTPPAEPITFGGGRVVLGGEVSAAIAPQDEGFFNYSDYEHSTLREVRLGVTALVRATDRIAVVTEIRSDNFEELVPFAFYARIRPFAARRLDVRIGRIPPAFGAMIRTAYGRDNPLIGYPLAYQYLTSLRADAAPADADELLRMRGRGWLSRFSVGNPVPARGVPLATAFSWDTGIQVSAGWERVTVTGALTKGSASNPRVTDDNDGKHLSARVAVTPVTGLVVGASFSRGEFLDRRVRAQLGADDRLSLAQQAHGVDVEYSRDHWIVRSEAVLSGWTLPLESADAPGGAAGRIGTTLRALALALEGRYTLLPGLYGAARVEHLAFSRITGTSGAMAWDAPVTRVEIGAGYYVQRNVIAKVSVQVNERPAGRVRQARLVAGQLLYWF